MKSSNSVDLPHHDHMRAPSPTQWMHSKSFDQSTLATLITFWLWKATVWLSLCQWHFFLFERTVFLYHTWSYSLMLFTYQIIVHSAEEKAFFTFIRIRGLLRCLTHKGIERLKMTMLENAQFSWKKKNLKQNTNSIWILVKFSFSSAFWL